MHLLESLKLVVVAAVVEVVAAAALEWVVALAVAVWQAAVVVALAVVLVWGLLVELVLLDVADL